MLNRLMLKLLLLLSFLLPLPAFAAPFNAMVVFGDSLSDNGNLAVLPGYEFLNNPPYQHGSTNGLNSVEQLAKQLGLPLTPSLYLTGTIAGNNFAVAGARAGGIQRIDLTAQVLSLI